MEMTTSGSVRGITRACRNTFSDGFSTMQITMGCPFGIVLTLAAWTIKFPVPATWIPVRMKELILPAIWFENSWQWRLSPAS